MPISGYSGPESACIRVHRRLPPDAGLALPETATACRFPLAGVSACQQASGAETARLSPFPAPEEFRHGRLRLGEPALKIPQAGLDRFLGSRNVLLLIETSPSKLRPPEVLKEAEARLSAVETALVTMRDAAPQYGEGACLIDRGGILRRAGQAGPAASDLVEFVELWRTGKVNYDLACARCHGADGNLDDYPRIKKLGGIGNRLGKEQILERVSPVELSRDEISVRSHLFTRRELDALIVYISGL